MHALLMMSASVDARKKAHFVLKFASVEREERRKDFGFFVLANDVRLQKPSSDVLTTGAISLMAGAFFLTASAFSIYRINQAPSVTLNTSAWGWLAETQFQLDVGQEAYGPLVGEAEIPEQPFVGPLAPFVFAVNTKAVEAQPAPVHAKAKTSLKHRLVARAKSILNLRKKTAVKTASIVEPTGVTPAIAKAAPAPRTIEAPAQTGASANELNTLQSLHQILRGRFVLAMTTQPAMADILIAQMGPTADSEKAERQPTQELAAVEVAPEKNEFHPLARKKAKLHHRPTAIVEVRETPSDSTVTTQPEEPKTIDSEVQDQVLTSQAAPEPEAQPQVEEPRAFDEVPALAVAPQVDYSADHLVGASPEQQESVTVHKDAEKAKAPESAQILVAAANTKTILNVPAVNTQTPAPTVHSNGGAITAPGQSRVAKQDAPAETAPNSNVLTTMSTQDAAAMVTAFVEPKQIDDYSPAKSVTTQRPTLVTTTMTEAFEWMTPVSGGPAQVISKEASDKSAGWAMAQAPEHWPTLARAGSGPIPMISKNTGRLLSALVSAPLQAEAGIVFGKVRAGWSVRLSGRAENPIFLNERNQSVAQGNIDSDRYFAFINAAPGAHLLYLTNRAGVEEGAVGIAVMSGTSTFADLSTVKKTTFTGRVLDGSDSSGRPMKGVTVRVLGSTNSHAETDRMGKFTIENVLTVGDHAVYVETDASAGYTHRYQLKPTKLQGSFLYRLSDTAIQTWVSQLEGSISPDSGIVVAALPELISSRGAKAKLTPALRSLAPNPTLTPEIYTLSPSGQMQVDKPLDAQNTRYMSVQVPEGPATTQLMDADHNVVWSEMIMVSPAVINLVGPY